MAEAGMPSDPTTDNDPARYQIMHVYLGAIFALENFEQTGSFVGRG
jgi:hypothetical protein